MKTKEYRGNCVDNPFGRIETLVEVVENAIEITKQTFFKHCFIHLDIARQMRQFPNNYEFFKYKDIYFYI